MLGRAVVGRHEELRLKEAAEEPALVLHLVEVADHGCRIDDLQELRAPSDGRLNEVVVFCAVYFQVAPVDLVDGAAPAARLAPLPRHAADRGSYRRRSHALRASLTPG